MDQRILSVFPRAKRLVIQIERAAGAEILYQVQLDYRAKAGCTFREAQGKLHPIIISGEVTITAADLLHELMHLHRYAVERVPYLQFADGFLNSEVADWLDNELEHLVIEPRMTRDYSIAHGDGLSELLRRFWTEDSVREDDERCQRVNYLVRWLTTRLLYPRADLLAAARHLLTERGLLAAAERFSAEVSVCGLNKEAVVMATCRALRIPPKAVGLLYVFPERRITGLPQRAVIPHRSGDLVLELARVA
jgi:hypothetical protein